MKILQEEKNYWAAQCLEAREQAERANALANAHLASYEGAKKAHAEMVERFDLLFKLMGIMQRTGYTTSVPLNRSTTNNLREHCELAEKYVRPKGRQSAIARKDLVLVAWRNNTTGSFYSDCRPLSVEESKRVQRVMKTGNKVPLYAIDPGHAEE